MKNYNSNNKKIMVIPDNKVRGKFKIEKTTKTRLLLAKSKDYGKIRNKIEKCKEL